MDLISTTVPLHEGELRLLQPSEGAELPDAGGVEWAPLIPYWMVLWRSGVALAREVSGSGPEWAGARVVELGCGLGAPSLVAARQGAHVLATDEDDEAFPLLERNARLNDVTVETAQADWDAADALVARGPFDLVLAADVLYDPRSVDQLLSLLPRLANEVWLADPGRSAAGDFLAEARGRWSIETTRRSVVQIHRLHGGLSGASSAPLP